MLHIKSENKAKDLYEEPLLTFLMFESKDVITLSNIDQDDNTGEWKPLGIWDNF